ncbi:MAG: hypothetical protein GYA23_13200 [Methanomicrobiales archaeon]|nr:hypothetical protein [Methanomicrobiales archaeon]
MGTIVIPFVLSSSGIADSIILTVGLWIFFIIVIALISIVYGFLKGELSLPAYHVTPGKVIATCLIALLGVIAFIINPLLLIPLLVLVLGILMFLEVRSLDPDKVVVDPEPDFNPYERCYQPRAPEDVVIDADYRVIEKPVVETQARPEKPGPVPDEPVPDDPGLKRAEAERSRYEEQKKREQEERRRVEEAGRLEHIHGLESEHFREYLAEAEKFRREYGKNIKCDVCGRWDGRLSVHRNQTYCDRCLPPSARKPGT